MLFAAVMGGPISAQSQVAKLEFFEQRIRPVLVDKCYKCHNSSGKKKARLALDSRAGLRQGGKTGPGLVLGKPDESLLMTAIRHSRDELRMPRETAKLSVAVIADFAQWIRDGAVDPRDTPPSAERLAASISWDAVRERRKKWWSFQPLGEPAPPVVTGSRWTGNPVDKFVFSKLEVAGVVAAPRADKHTLIRRLSFTLTGLPPSSREVRAFVKDASPNAYRKLVDRLLASPRFGERWARHWMDWVRYAESHGSEGDPTIPNAWRFRDYLIRALNADVPYEQLVREQIAGDLLPEPRIDTERSINQSTIGIAQYRFVQHGFAPTDALDEQVRFTDNQIDVVTKAFLGMTVSCARCHNHKFDPLAQADFYSLYGIMTSCRPAQVCIDTPARLATNKPELRASKARIKSEIAKAWLHAAKVIPERLQDAADKTVTAALRQAAKNDKHPLHALARLKSGEAWETLAKRFDASARELALAEQRIAKGGWDLANAASYKGWFQHGNGLGTAPSPPGGFQVRREGEQVLNAVLPGGVYSHLLSDKHSAVLGSPAFDYDMKAIYLRVTGDGNAKARYVVRGYPRSGTVYPVHNIRGGKWRWVRWDTSYWNGDRGYLEVSTAADQPVLSNTRASRSWIGVSRVVFASEEQVRSGKVPKDHAAEFVAPIYLRASGSAPRSVAALARLYGLVVTECVTAWSAATLTDAQAHFLTGLIDCRLLPSNLGDLPGLARELAIYRELEAGVPVPTRVCGVLEAEPIDQPMFVRGDHKQPGEPVRRRFLEAIDAEPYQAKNSGRLELARDFVRPDNPLTSRVAVNRIWHHVFGLGLVATPDNFGRMGETPSHPELLDFLARHFVKTGWSMKSMIRLLVNTETFCLDSRPSASARSSDPENRLLSHFRLRRLEAEAIRDALLWSSGELDLAMFGPPQGSGSLRRSIYLRVQRNRLDPFLSTFDFPEPHTTRGRRDSTNVPGQALAMLNDPFVIRCAAALARGRQDNGAEVRSVVARMFEDVFSRPATADELDRCQAYMDARGEEHHRRVAELQRLDRQIATASQELSRLVEPIRTRLQAARKTSKRPRPTVRPIAAWEFDGDLRDSIGAMHGEKRGALHFEDGALVLNGRGHVVTAPLDKPLGAKTLSVWVKLRDLGQRGGGVMSVESPGGATFDSIVYAEKQSRRWLAGSNFFRRTRAFAGSAESAAAQRPVHLAITYAADGTIRAYRDGKPYGKGYKSSGLFAFPAGGGVVLFGLRHSPFSPGKAIRARLLRAALYDRDLSADEVARSSGAVQDFVGRTELLAAMTKPQQGEHQRVTGRLAELHKARNEIKKNEAGESPPELQDLAQCLFNLKEFLYLR